MCNTAKKIWKTLLITHQGNNQVKDNKIYLLVQQYEEFIISKDESIDSAFARFNTIITSLKSLDEGYSSKNYIRKFLRALHPKWRAKVTEIEESKDLTSLSLDELIGNLKVHKIIIKKDSKIVKAKVERKLLALKAKKELVMKSVRLSVVKTKNKNQRAFVRGSWSDSGEEDDEKVKDKTCLVAHASNEELVPQPKNMAIIGTKWVFRNKLDENGVVSRNKARLVAQGYNQQEGIDYDETYALVARLESIRILLAYVCTLDFKLFQMDVKVHSLTVLSTKRPDIMFSVCLCSRFQEAPKTSHLEAVKRIFRYSIGNMHLGLWYPKGTGIETVAYADSDHVGDYVDRKSTSGICTFVGYCLTSWFSKKQTALAISTTESKCVSARKACQQAL
nr:copia protein [Tanacetum cinerariifolium]